MPSRSFMHKVHLLSHDIPIGKQVDVGDQMGTRLSRNGLSHLSNQLKRHSPVDVTHWFVAHAFFFARSEHASLLDSHLQISFLLFKVQFRTQTHIKVCRGDTLSHCGVGAEFS